MHLQVHEVLHQSASSVRTEQVCEIKSCSTAGAHQKSLPAPFGPIGSRVLTTRGRWMFSTDSATSKSFLSIMQWCLYVCRIAFNFYQIDSPPPIEWAFHLTWTWLIKRENKVHLLPPLRNIFAVKSMFPLTISGFLHWYVEGAASLHPCFHPRCPELPTYINITSQIKLPAS